MKRILMTMALFSGLLTAGLTADQTMKMGTIPAKQHIMLTEKDLQWGPAPASLPAGAQAAILEGDPTQPGLFTMRLKFPAGYKVPAHWHPADEHATILEGMLSMGLGDKFDSQALQDLPVGGFAVMPAGVRHFAWCKDGVTIQLHGMGPWGVTYVNPQDDPRKRTSK